MTKPELTDRELDAWLAKNLMGLAVIPDEVPGYYTPVGAKAFDADLLIPQYSTDLVAAFELVEKMDQLGFWYQLSSSRHPMHPNVTSHLIAFAKFGDEPTPNMAEREREIPKAIALAAKKATESNL